MSQSPPENNEYSGFPIGSWIEKAGFYVAPGGLREDFQLRLCLTDLHPDGSFSMEGFTRNGERWIRNEYRTGTETGALIDLDGWQVTPREHIIWEKDGPRKYVEIQGWERVLLPDEDLRIGERLIRCQVHEWTSGSAATRARLRIWFGNDVHVPRHIEGFGSRALTLYTSPQIVRFEWEQGGVRSVREALALDEPYMVNGKTMKCVRWSSTSADQTQISWFSDAVPGRLLKTQGFNTKTNAHIHESYLVNFHVQTMPLDPTNMKLEPGPWHTFRVGAWVKLRIMDKRHRDQPDSVVKLTYRGVNSKGFPILMKEYLAGENAGVITCEMPMPYPEINDIRSHLDKESRTSIRIGRKEFGRVEKMYNCKSMWDNEWKAVIGICEELRLPWRKFADWIVELSLGEHVVSAATKVEDTVLARKVDAFDEKIKIGSRNVSCLKESEHLSSPNQARTTEYWHSLDVPGHLVKSISSPDGLAPDEIVEVLEFSSGLL